MGESMAKYTKEDARGIIFAGAAKYKEKLSDREAAAVALNAGKKQGLQGGVSVKFMF